MSHRRNSRFGPPKSSPSSALNCTLKGSQKLNDSRLMSRRVDLRRSSRFINKSVGSSTVILISVLLTHQVNKACSVKSDLQQKP